MAGVEVHQDDVSSMTDSGIFNASEVASDVYLSDGASYVNCAASFPGYKYPSVPSITSTTIPSLSAKNAASAGAAAVFECDSDSFLGVYDPSVSSVDDSILMNSWFQKRVISEFSLEEGTIDESSTEASPPTINEDVIQPPGEWNNWRQDQVTQRLPQKLIKRNATIIALVVVTGLVIIVLLSLVTVAMNRAHPTQNNDDANFVVQDEVSNLRFSPLPTMEPMKNSNDSEDDELIHTSNSQNAAIQTQGNASTSPIETSVTSSWRAYVVPTKEPTNQPSVKPVTASPTRALPHNGTKSPTIIEDDTSPSKRPASMDTAFGVGVTIDDNSNSKNETAFSSFRKINIPTMLPTDTAHEESKDLVATDNTSPTYTYSSAPTLIRVSSHSPSGAPVKRSTSTAQLISSSVHLKPTETTSFQSTSAPAHHRTVDPATTLVQYRTAVPVVQSPAATVDQPTVPRPVTSASTQKPITGGRPPRDATSSRCAFFTCRHF